jgi:acid phosphatase family membrane protein YuiD
MDIFNDIFTNKCLVIPILVWLLIQIEKFVVEFIRTKKINLKRLMGAGGMPSSHSAVVTSLAVLVGKSEGFDSPIFAIAFILAAVVMYDAAGVRRAAGKQAELLNKIVETPGLTNAQVGERLAEVLGHTPLQVFVGAILGVLVGIIV